VRTLSRPLAALLLTLALSATNTLAQDASKAEARALLEKMLQQSGGKQRLRGIYAYRQKQRVQLQSAKGAQYYSWDLLVALPDRIHLESTSDSGQKFTLVVSLAGAFVNTGGTITELLPATAGIWQTAIRRNGFYIAQHIDDGGVQAALEGTESIAGTMTRIIRLTLGADVLRMWLDTRTLRAIRISVQAEAGKNPQVVEPDDFRRADGILFPFHVTVSQDGAPIAVQDVQGVEFNPPVDPRLFYRQPLLLEQLAFTPVAAPPAPASVGGTLQVVSQPHGAQLYLDDVAKGVTSESEGRLVLEDVLPGSHRVRLTAAGFREWSKTVAVESGDSVAVDANLERSGPPPFTENDVEQMLRGGVSAKRAAVLVKERGVDFAMDDAAEQRLRAAGADGDLLLAIAKAKK